ncbi:MAG: PspC domain-containing protein [Saprospiraceae bacterium]|nr:PspC domain-containing protein [Saprospiraceae bacterium]
MNKVININLGGHALTIDDNAYELLDRYLKRLKRHFQGSVGFENIMQDIELRMAELMTENMGNREIASRDDVNKAIETMGQPEQLTDDSGQQDSYYTEEGHYTKREKRLFRDPDNKVISGVCSGLAAYLGIDDPLWIRLLFVASVLFAGFGVLPYIILWIVMPEAKTSAEKLSMHGEPVNINSIANKIQEDLSDLGRKISDLGQELRNK